jgi:hypothetical protein
MGNGCHADGPGLHDRMLISFAFMPRRAGLKA